MWWPRVLRPLRMLPVRFFLDSPGFIEPIVLEFGWSYTLVSMIAAIRGVNMGLFSPVAGILVDRFGSRKIMLIGFLIMFTGLVLLSQTKIVGVVFRLLFVAVVWRGRMHQRGADVGDGQLVRPTRGQGHGNGGLRIWRGRGLGAG